MTNPRSSPQPEVVLDPPEQQSAPLDRRVAVSQLFAVEHSEFADARTLGKLLPAQVDVVPVFARAEAVPEVEFIPFARPDDALDDLGVGKEMLDDATGWIALAKRRVAGLFHALVGSLTVP